MTSGRKFGLVLFERTVPNRPIRNEPVTLMRNVPSGNRVVVRLTTARPIMYRSREPAAPPPRTQRYRVKGSPIFEIERFRSSSFQLLLKFHRGCRYSATAVLARGCTQNARGHRTDAPQLGAPGVDRHRCVIFLVSRSAGSENITKVTAAA